MSSPALHRSGIPLYVQIASAMRRRISTGVWAAGEQVPTLEALANEFKVARLTVRQAIFWPVSTKFVNDVIRVAQANWHGTAVTCALIPASSGGVAGLHPKSLPVGTLTKLGPVVSTVQV